MTLLYPTLPFPHNLKPLTPDNILSVEQGDWVVTPLPIRGDVDGWGEVSYHSGIGCVSETRLRAQTVSLHICFPPGVDAVLSSDDPELSQFYLVAPPE